MPFSKMRGRRIYSAGTVFYLYTPLRAIPRAVLDSVAREAAGRKIRICTFGPCTPTVAEEQWLSQGGVGDGLDRCILLRV
jgi:hypothetical protein